MNHCQNQNKNNLSFRFLQFTTAVVDDPIILTATNFWVAASNDLDEFEFVIQTTFSKISV